MKKYLLLRNNRQSGPYTIEQVGSINLLPMDLIWIENESTVWKHPEEIKELKSHVKHQDKADLEQDLSNKNEKVFVLLPSECIKKNEQERAIFSIRETGNIAAASIAIAEKLKENYRTPVQPIQNRNLVPLKNISAVAAICIGVMLGAFVIKKWVDGSAPDTVQAAVAIPVIDRQPTPTQPGEDFKNALVTEIVPVYKTPSKKNSKSTDVKKQLKLETNDYKVGLFGGINGLQLTVFNTSAQYVDKVIVALDYLNPNGTVIESENVLFTSIKPKGAQTIAIPGSNRGVKLRYKILKVYSHDYKVDVKEV